MTRVSITIVTPFSPAITHHHAADDIAAPSFAAIAKIANLTVIARGSHASEIRHSSRDGYSLYELPAARTGRLRRYLGCYPAGLRDGWTTHDSRLAAMLVDRVGSQYLHFEYLQPSEAALRRRGPWTITLHDITSIVFRQRFATSTGVERGYRWAEYRRALRLERRVVTSAETVFTLSQRDAAVVHDMGGSAVPLMIGVKTESLPPRCRPQSPVFVFAGALSRPVNAEAAELLARQVMPLVWDDLPQARLRIVGAGAGPAIERLAADHRVEVVGEVPDLDAEYRSASAVFAPTVVDAGVLIKALRGAACEIPLILNQSAAAPIGLVDGVHAVVGESPSDLARGAVRLVREPAWAAAMAARAREHVRVTYSWARYAADFVRGVTAGG